MTIQKIIQEAINKSPLNLKEALESELRSRISEAIAEKMEEVEELDEISKSKLDDYQTKSHDEFKRLQQAGGRSAMNSKQTRRYTDHPYKNNPGNTAFDKLVGRARVNATESAEFEELDEISKSKLDDYQTKSHDEFKRLAQAGGKMNSKQTRRYGYDGPGETAFKKLTGRARVNATEGFDLSDYTIEELEDFMESAEFDQLDEISKKTLASYVKKASDSRAYAAADRKDYKMGGPLYNKMIKIGDKRKAGISRAVDRLAK